MVSCAGRFRDLKKSRFFSREGVVLLGIFGGTFYREIAKEFFSTIPDSARLVARRPLCYTDPDEIREGQ